MTIKGLIIDSLIYPVRNANRLLILYLLFFTIFLMTPSVFALGYPYRLITHNIHLYILLLAGFLMIPSAFALGYIYRLITQITHDSDNNLPIFSELKSILSDGLKLLITNLIYFLIPSILSFIIFGFLLQHVNTNLLAYLFFMIIGLFAVAFTLTLGYIVFEQRFMSIFEFGRIISFIITVGKQDISKIILIYLIVEVIGGLIFLLRSLALTNIIFSLVIVLFLAYLALSWVRLTGLLFHDSMKNS